MILLIVIIVLAIALVWASATYLPRPINWIGAGLIILLAAVYLFSGNVEID
jgi:hypothetical protein